MQEQPTFHVAHLSGFGERGGGAVGAAEQARAVVADPPDMKLGVQHAMAVIALKLSQFQVEFHVRMTASPLGERVLRQRCRVLLRHDDDAARAERLAGRVERAQVSVEEWRHGQKLICAPVGELLRQLAQERLVEVVDEGTALVFPVAQPWGQRCGFGHVAREGGARHALGDSDQECVSASEHIRRSRSPGLVYKRGHQLCVLSEPGASEVRAPHQELPAVLAHQQYQLRVEELPGRNVLDQVLTVQQLGAPRVTHREVVVSGRVRGDGDRPAALQRAVSDQRFGLNELRVKRVRADDRGIVGRTVGKFLADMQSPQDRSLRHPSIRPLLNATPSRVNPSIPSAHVRRPRSRRMLTHVWILASRQGGR